MAVDDALMEHLADLKWQAYCEKIGALPLNPLECGNTNLGIETSALKLVRNADAPILICGGCETGSSSLDIETLLIFTGIGGHQGVGRTRRLQFFDPFG